MEKIQEKLANLQKALDNLEKERLDCAEEPSSSTTALELAQVYKVGLDLWCFNQ